MAAQSSRTLQRSSSKQRLRPVIEVLIVDPSPFSRACTMAGLATAPDLAVNACGTLSDWSKAERPDVVLFQSQHGHGGASQIAEQLTRASRRWPSVITLVVTDEGHNDQLFESIRSGADGLLTSSVSLDAMTDAIRMLMKNLAIYPSEAVALFRKAFFSAQGAGDRTEARKPDPIDIDHSRRLTPRQLDVLRLLAKGLSNRAIAQQLKISESTVKVHIRAIMTQAGVANRTQVVAYFMRGRSDDA